MGIALNVDGTTIHAKDDAVIYNTLIPAIGIYQIWNKFEARKALDNIEIGSGVLQIQGRIYAIYENEIDTLALPVLDTGQCCTSFVVAEFSNENEEEHFELKLINGSIQQTTTYTQETFTPLEENIVGNNIGTYQMLLYTLDVYRGVVDIHDNRKFVQNIDMESVWEAINEANKKADNHITQVTKEFETVNTRIENINTEVDNLKKSVSDGKEKVATAITQQGVAATKDDTFQQLSDKILQIETGNNQFNANDLTLKRCEILDSSKDSLKLKGTSTDSYHADYIIDGIANKMKVLSFHCEMESTNGNSSIVIYDNDTINLYNIEENTSNIVDIVIPIVYDKIEIRFSNNSDYTNVSEATFTNINLTISESKISLDKATATADQVLEGQTFYNNEGLITGTMVTGSTNEFNPTNLYVMTDNVTIINSSKNDFSFSGNGEAYGTDYDTAVSYEFANQINKMLSFKCKFSSSMNQAKVYIEGSNTESGESNSLIEFDEIADNGNVDLYIPIPYNFMRIIFLSNDLSDVVNVTNINLNISDEYVNYITTDTYADDVINGKKFFSSGTFGLGTGSLPNMNDEKVAGYSDAFPNNAVFDGFNPGSVVNTDGKLSVCIGIPKTGKYNAYSYLRVPAQEKTVVPSNSQQSIYADSGYLLEKVTVPSLVCKGIYKDIFQGMNITTVTDRPIFDAGNSNKKGVFLFVENISSGLVMASHDNSTWETIIDLSEAQTVPKVALTSNRSYRYFKATFTGYSGKNSVIAWGVFNSQ